jgi:hypothetical protein
VGTDPYPLKQTITSVAGASLATLGIRRLLSVTLGPQPPGSVELTEGIASRPRLRLLSGGGRSDVELMRCFRAGDWAGFEALYERYFAMAYLICRQSLGCPGAALDSTQDTFLALLAHGELLNPYRLNDWLRGTAHYLAERRARCELQPNNGSRLRLFSCYSIDDHRAGERP